MRIRLLQDIPVSHKHNLTQGRILDVLYTTVQSGGEPAGYWVLGDAGETVKILQYECVEVK